jgi:hypothetical protein
MEEKRKGYKTQEQQNEANKRYRATEEGKEKTKHSTYKSRAKVFINEMATLEELEELENLIKNKKLGGIKMKKSLKEIGKEISEYVIVFEEEFEMTSLDDRSTLVSNVLGYIKKEEIEMLKKEFIKDDFFDRNKKTYYALNFNEFDVLDEDEEEIEYRDCADGVIGKNFIYQKAKKGQFYEVESYIEENPEYLDDNNFFEALEYLEPRIKNFK